MKKTMFLVAAAMSSSFAFSQDSSATKKLDEVIVTATKTEIKQSQTGKVVIVIDRGTLQRSAGKTIAEVLNYQAGIFVNGANSSLGTNQDLYLRGASTGKTLILIDGTPVSDASQIGNFFDLNNLNVDQVERIEILKGAQSTLWGSDAVAGIINIITKKSSITKLAPVLSVAYGSYNTFRGNAGISGTINKLSYLLNYGNVNSKGFSSALDTTGTNNFDKDGFKQNTGLAKIGYKFTNALNAEYRLSYAKYKTDIDAGAFKDDKDYRYQSSNLTNSLAVNYKASNYSLHFLQSLTQAKRNLIDDSASVGGFAKYARGNYEGGMAVSDLYGDVKLNAHFSLVAGAQYLTQNTSQSYTSISSFGPFSTVPVNKDTTDAHNISGYASVLFLNENGLHAEAGVRVNNSSLYGTNTTYSFNPAYNINGNTKVFINISSAYKIPSLYQLYSEYGNTALNPEKSKNYELGVQTTNTAINSSFRMVAFKRDIKDVIVFYTDANYNSQYINRDEQHDYGFEIESNIRLGKTGNWQTNATYVDGDGIENDIKVKNLYRRPNFTFNSTLTLAPVKNLVLAPSFRFVGTRTKGEFDAGPQQMPQYYTIDFYTSYTIAQKANFFIDLRNITNQKYTDVPGYTTRSFNMMGGVQLSF